MSKKLVNTGCGLMVLGITLIILTPFLAILGALFAQLWTSGQRPGF